MNDIKEILKSKSLTNEELIEMLEQLAKLIEHSPSSDKPKKTKQKKILTDMEVLNKKSISPFGGFVEQGVRYGNEYLTYFYRAFKRLPMDLVEFRRFVLEHC